MKVKTYNLTAAAVSAIEAIALSDAQNERTLLDNIPALRKQFNGWAEDTVREAVRTNYAAAVGIELTQRGKSMVWPSNDPRSVAAKRQCNRIVERILGETSERKAGKTRYDIPADLMQAALEAVAVANTYEDAKALMAQAIAKAFAAK
jgi:cytolysin (calcineurin-like family phosphatase)